jgi:hypothetical protein
MALADVIVAINARLTGVTAKLGAEWVDDLTSPPRITWVPTNDAYTGAWKTGSPTGIKAAGNPPVGVVPSAHYARSLKTRSAGVEVHLWAAGASGDADEHKHLRATEALLNRLLWHTHVIAYGSYEIEGGDWKQAQHNTYGRGYLLRLRFYLPVTAVTGESGESTTTVDTVQQTGSYSDTGGTAP